MYWLTISYCEPPTAICIISPWGVISNRNLSHTVVNTCLYMYVCMREPFSICIHYRVQNIGFRVTGMAWWRHQMEIFSALLAICTGNSPVTGGFPAQRTVTRNFDVSSSLICAWINGWVNNGEAGDLRRYRAHCNVIVMDYECSLSSNVMKSNLEAKPTCHHLGACGLKNISNDGGFFVILFWFGRCLVF